MSGYTIVYLLHHLKFSHSSEKK